MNAEEKKLEQNDLIRWITTFLTKLKTGQLIGPKTLGVILLVLLGGGLWYFLSGQGAKADSKNWANLDAAQTQQDYKALIEAKANANVVFVSRITLARIKLREGIAELPMMSGPFVREGTPTRKDGIVKLEQAREELLAIAKDLEKSKDRVLRTECLFLASQAELGLTGVPKTGVPILERQDVANHRGSIKEAVKLLRDASKVIGESSEAGELLKKRADELETADADAKKDSFNNPTPTRLGIYLDEQLHVEPTPQITPITPSKIDDRPPTTNRTPTTGR